MPSQFGGVEVAPSSSGSQFGGVPVDGSDTPNSNPGIMSRIGNQVGDFFSTASHAMNPENLMAQVPTSWEDLKNKWQSEKADLQAHGQGAVNQFKQGNIGTGVSTLMNAEPFIGQPTGQAAEYLRQGNVGKAAGTLAPYFIPALPEGASAAGRGVKNATNAGLDWAAQATEPMQSKAAQMINAHPTIAKGVVGAASAVPVYMAAHGLSHDVGLSGLGSLYAAREAAKHFGNAAVDWAKNYPDLAEPEPIIPAKGSPSQSGVPIPRGDVYTGTTGTAAPASTFTGTVGSPSTTPAAPVGPSPQLLKDIAKAVGPKGSVQDVLNDMIAKGTKDPYTGATLETPPTTTQPPPTQPAPVSAPQQAIPQTPAPSVRPPDGPVISDTWTDKAGNNYPVNMISPDQLQAHAQKYGQPIAASRAEIEGQGITIPDTKTIRNSLVYRAKKMGVGEDQLKQMAQDDYQREGIGDMTSTELMDAYGNMLKRQGPFSEQHHADVLYNKQNKAQILPMQPAEGTSNLSNVAPFGWPQP